MKVVPASLLQATVGLIGIGALAFLLWEPHIEGRNTHATMYEIYFEDPFLAFVYLGSAPFFMALYRAYRLFGHLDRNEGRLQSTADTLRSIQRCAMAVIAFAVVGAVIVLVTGDEDDRPVGVFMWLLVTTASSAVAAVSAMSARRTENALRRSRAPIADLRTPLRDG